MKAFLRRLSHNDSGSVVIEFALLAPLLMTLLLGVFQVGIGMQNYNALRGAADDAARFAVINYQTGTRPSETTLTAQARTIATSMPYRLTGTRLTANFDILDTTRVAGATEATLTMTYTIPSLLGVMGMDDITIRYNRSVFLLS